MWYRVGTWLVFLFFSIFIIDLVIRLAKLINSSKLSREFYRVFYTDDHVF